MLLFIGCDSEADIAILLDSSSSIQSGFQNNWPFLLDFVKTFVSSLDLNRIRVSVIRYGNSANVEFPLDRFSRVEDMRTAIDNIVFSNQGSNIAAAFRVGVLLC